MNVVVLKDYNLTIAIAQRDSMMMEIIVLVKVIFFY